MSSDIDALKAALRAQAETLLVELFGEPTQRMAREWRWGSKGSASYRLDRGTFWSFEADQGGSLLDTIMFANSCSFPQAVTWARAWLGDDATARPKPSPRKGPTFDASAEQQLASSEASTLWRAGRSINGTAAARYLQGRAIDGWPVDSVRLIGGQDVARIAWRWWRYPALMFPLTNDVGTVTAVQLVALTDQGEAVPHWEHGGKIKMVRGVARGSALRLPGNASGPLMLAEGPETALSIWLATGYETWANMGSIARAPLDGVPLSRTVVVCRDDDPRSALTKDGGHTAPKLSPSLKTLKDAVRKWRKQGRRVVEAQPWRLSRGDKSDFNDLLRRGGVEAVRKGIEATLHPREIAEGEGPAAAGASLARAVDDAIGGLLAPSAYYGDGPFPQFRVIQATLGLGKSEIALRALLKVIAKGHRVIVSAPSHALAEDLARRFQEMSVASGSNATVRVWRGRKRPDPVDSDQTMCRDLDAVALAHKAKMSAFDTVCPDCKHRVACPYLDQQDATADLWVVPHALLFSDRPKAMAGAAILVIDEDFAMQGLEGVEGPPDLVHVDRLQSDVTAGHGDAKQSADLNAELGPIRKHLLKALEGQLATERGEPLQRASLVAAGLTQELTQQAATASAKRLIMRLDKRDQATRALKAQALQRVAAVNSEAVREISLWRRVGELLADEAAIASGRIMLVETDAGRALRLYGVKPIGKGWRDMPALHLDATADMDLIRLRVPHATVEARIEAVEPYVSVHQVVGKAFGKTALKGTALDDARQFIVSLAVEHGGHWLAIANKDAAGALRKVMPEYVSLAHWGSIRGLDTYGDVEGIVTVGRWGVPPNDAGRLAGILTGRAVPDVKGWYPVEAVTINAADGKIHTMDVDRHPDPLAEAVRRSIVEAELLQAIGRGRGVRRGPGNPLTVYVLGNVLLPLPLATIREWEPVNRDAAMMADFGAVLSSPTDAGRLLGQDAETARKARQRCGTGPDKYYLYGHVPDLRCGHRVGFVRYKVEAPGRREQFMAYDTERIRRPGKWLAARVGAPVTLTAHHTPNGTRGRFFSSLVTCQITGQMNFRFAPEPRWEAEPSDDDSGNMLQGNMNLDEVSMTAEEAFAILVDAVPGDLDECADILARGAEAQGVSMSEVYEWARIGLEAWGLSQDESTDPERLEMYRRLAEACLDRLDGLVALGGQLAHAQPKGSLQCVN
jgi:putative DNA primase/helicase